MITYFRWSSYLIVLYSFVIASCETKWKEKTLARPNVLLMVADDMGWADLGSYGGNSFTPNLDILAAEGVRLTNFYAAAPNCSPSRAGLMTGKIPARVGMYNYRPGDHPMHLPADEYTLAELFTDADYQTAHIGKWHLGELPASEKYPHPQPNDQGFSYSLGTENNAHPSHLNPVNFVRNGKKLDTLKGYSCQILADETINWLQEKHDPDKPFFIYLAFHEPHMKVASPPELVKGYNKYPPDYAEYLANIENLDQAAGRVIYHLRQSGVFDNTIIIFSSDNGSYRQQANGPLRAVKSYLYEGGIRVPGIFHWAGQWEPKVIDTPAGFLDLMPTMANLLKQEITTNESLDGSNILPLLRGENFFRKNPLHWFFYRTSPEIALRKGKLMIMGRDNDTIPRTHKFTAPDMEYIKTMDLDSFELYDLSVDPGQTNNLIKSHPQAEELKYLIREKLEIIQNDGPEWQNLPEASGKMQLKTDWVKY